MKRTDLNTGRGVVVVQSAAELAARLAEPIWRGQPVVLQELAKYLRELRVMGGKANELAAEFQDWFAGLWEGEALARTIVVLISVAPGRPKALSRPLGGQRTE